VDTNINLGFAQGLRSILRQDPDVIMVGEIRDGDTAQIAIRAAMTGHLVFSTLHTNSALGAVDALLHLGAVPFMVSGSLVGILSQRLVRRLCRQCRRGLMIKPEMCRRLGLPENTRKKIYKARGCDHCLGSGYFGRSGVFEVITIEDAMRPFIARADRDGQLEAIVRERRMHSLAEAAAQKVLAGETSLEEVSRKILFEV
jgi:type II secretory ATPase GspE/PulE/Tfp pilus assembly ATPase PilB-like protein